MEKKSYVLTAAARGLGISSGKAYGIPILKVAEGILFAALAVVIIMSCPILFKVRLFVAAIYGVTIFCLCLYGVRGEDVVGYFVGYVRRKTHAGTYVLGAPVKDERAVPKKKAPEKKKESLLWRIADRLEN